MDRTTTLDRVHTALLVAYLAGLAFILLNPYVAVPTTGIHGVADVADSLGAPIWVLEPERFEFLSNALIFVPLPVLGTARWPSTTWRDWTAYGFIGSGGVELFQGLFLPERSATFVDLAANTLGALAGGVVVALLRRGRTSAP